MRKFEILPEWEGIVDPKNMPRRETLKSAGYDLKAAEDVVIPTIWKNLADFLKALNTNDWDKKTDTDNARAIADEKRFRATMIPTGLTAYFEDDEVLKLHVRSSVGWKWLTTLANNVGIIDADYSDKGGHIMIPMINFGFKDRHIKKGEAVAQGIFSKFLVTDDDFPSDKERDSGFGHTDGEGKNK